MSQEITNGGKIMGNELNNVISKSLGKKTNIQPLIDKLKEKDRATVTALLQALDVEKKLLFDELREAISVIRDFAAKDKFLVEDPSKGSIEPYIEMGIACRNSMVKILKLKLVRYFRG